MDHESLNYYGIDVSSWNVTQESPEKKLIHQPESLAHARTTNEIIRRGFLKSQPYPRRTDRSARRTRSAMISTVILSMLLLIVARGSLAGTEHILRIKASNVGSSVRKHRDTRQQPPYSDHRNESTTWLHRELEELLQQTINAVHGDTCRDEYRSVLTGLHDLAGWAVKFYDATAKIPTGVLAGSVYQLGNFDECLDLGPGDGAPAGIRGRYCLAEVDVQVPEIYFGKNGSIWEAFRDAEERYREPIRKLYWGICLPAGCAAEDIEQVVRKILDVALNDSRLGLTVAMSEVSCYMDEFEPVGTADIVYM